MFYFLPENVCMYILEYSNSMKSPHIFLHKLTNHLLKLEYQTVTVTLGDTNTVLLQIMHPVLYYLPTSNILARLTFKIKKKSITIMTSGIHRKGMCVCVCFHAQNCTLPHPEGVIPSGGKGKFRFQNRTFNF